MNQPQQIIKHIDRYGFITSITAAKIENITSLHRNITTLEQLGYTFSKVVKISKKGKWYKEYRITKRPKVRR